MAKIALPYTIINGDAVDAGPVQSNYQAIETYSNQELIERGGTVAMTAQLKLVGNPVAALDAAPKQYVDTMIPIGGILLYGGTTAPAGGIWLLCDGTEYQQANYPELAQVIGAVAGRFNVPALVDKFPVGGGGAYAHKATGGRPDAIVPLHTHPIDHGHGASAGTDTPDHLHAVDHYHSSLAGSAASAGDHAHGSPLSSSRGFLSDGIGGESAGLDTGEENAYAITAFTATNGAHTHSISGNTNYMSQTPGQGAYSVGANVRHSHAVTVNGMSGASGQASGGIDPALGNLPPYFALAFIIRAK